MGVCEQAAVEAGGGGRGAARGAEAACAHATCAQETWQLRGDQRRLWQVCQVSGGWLSAGSSCLLARAPAPQDWRRVKEACFTLVGAMPACMRKPHCRAGRCCCAGGCAHQLRCLSLSLGSYHCNAQTLGLSHTPGNSPKNTRLLATLKNRPAAISQPHTRGHPAARHAHTARGAHPATQHLTGWANTHSTRNKQRTHISARTACT